MNEKLEQQIKELTAQRDLLEHKMHMTDWHILMIKRAAAMDKDFIEDKDNVESN